MDTNLFIQKTIVNETKGYIYYESEVYETFTANKKRLFDSLQQEYGRCAGCVYVGDSQKVGWIFEKNQQYSDCNDTYLQQVWVTLHKAPPVRTIKYNYQD